MATTKEYKDFVLEALRSVPSVTAKPMMGEWLVYSEGVYYAGIFDNRFLLKKTAGNARYGFSEALPYEGAKTMYLVDNLDDADFLKEISAVTVEDLRKKKK